MEFKEQNHMPVVHDRESRIGNTFGTTQKTCKETTKKASQAFETILHKTGDYNRYQWKLVFVAGFCGLFTAWHNMGAVFLAASPDHWCNIPYFEENNITLEKSNLNSTVPWVRGKDGVLEPSRCKYYDYDYKNVLNQEYLPLNSTEVDVLAYVHLSPTEEKSCDSWIYDNQIFKSTVVTEWNLVCDKRWKMSATQASFMMGILAGAIIFSVVSDKIGRRPATLISCCLFIVASIWAAFPSSFALFLILRFIVAGSGQGMFLVNFVLVMETASIKGRTVFGIIFHLIFAIGFSFLSLIAYIFRDWRDFQLAISVPAIVLLGYFWLLSESPRWLLMQGHEEEGVKLLKSISKFNKKDFPSDEEMKLLLSQISDEVGNKATHTFKEKMKSVIKSVVSLVRTPNMRKRSLIMFYTWFVTSMVYYGLTFTGATLNASIYLTVFLAGFIEVPGIFIIMILISKFGRRINMVGGFLLGGIAIICVIAVPTDMVALKLALNTLGKIGATVGFLICFLYSTELVPTDVRNLSIGLASMFARFGSASVPFIVDLLGEVYYVIPFVIFGVLSIIAGLLTLLLPETGNERLPETIEEIEAMPR